MFIDHVVCIAALSQGLTLLSLPLQSACANVFLRRCFSLCFLILASFDLTKTTDSRDTTERKDKTKYWSHMTHFRVGLNFVLSGLYVRSVQWGGARTDNVLLTSHRRLDEFPTSEILAGRLGLSHSWTASHQRIPCCSPPFFSFRLHHVTNRASERATQR